LRVVTADKTHSTAVKGYQGRPNSSQKLYIVFFSFVALLGP